MASNHAIKFFAIAKYFANSEKQLQRGENAYTSGHVINMTFVDEIKPALIKGDVQASMRKRIYKVEVSINLETQVILASSCTCPRGQALCHHQAALLYNAHYNISSTDIARQWGTRGKIQTEDATQTIDDLYQFKHDYEPFDEPVLPAHIEEFRQNLGQTNVVGFSWLMKPIQDLRIQNLVPSIEELLFSAEYINGTDKEAYFLEKCHLKSENILKIADATKGQHMNESWLVTRKNRLTASKFGMVLKACLRQRYPPSLFKSLIEGYSLDGVLAVQWGKDNERTAIETFTTQTDLTTVDTGLWLDECGFLGASPDGLVADNAILEVKCPFKFRQIGISEGVKDKKYLFYFDNGDVVINKEHNYYHQVQGQLYLTNREQCYFFVWTPIDCECILIEKDEQWMDNVEVLKKIYLQKYIPFILKS